MAGLTLEIPLRTADDELLEVRHSDLINNWSDIIDIMKTHTPAPECHLKFAKKR
ncbi:hypothetical protein HK096_010101 [Nowakowskiella sp. JEL0078]|nr:hypothetical protein HK096_010101 [Nowakowskiella sp. JEL0078]